MGKKKPMQSKTIIIGSVYISAAVLLGVLQMLDSLEGVIAPMVSSDSVGGWGSVVLAIVGGIQIWLRLVTDKPIGLGSDD